MNLSTTGWNALTQAQPIDPLNVIANCAIGATQGVWSRSTNFLQSTWGTNSLAFTGNNTTVISLNSTDAGTVADAAQWVVRTKMVNVSANINPSMSKVGFVRAGSLWQSQLEIAMGRNELDERSTRIS